MRVQEESEVQTCPPAPSAGCGLAVPPGHQSAPHPNSLSLLPPPASLACFCSPNPINTSGKGSSFNPTTDSWLPLFYLLFPRSGTFFPYKQNMASPLLPSRSLLTCRFIRAFPHPFCRAEASLRLSLPLRTLSPPDMSSFLYSRSPSATMSAPQCRVFTSVSL